MNPWKKEVIIGDARLLLGDCLEILPTLPKVDAVITDPPYGVNLIGKVTKHTTTRGQLLYEDSEEKFRSDILPRIHAAINSAERAAIFSGVRRLQEYPPARDIGGIICPNGGGRSPWGFGCFNPVLFYGKPPKGRGARPTATVMYHPGMHVTGENDNGHPCPKPIAFMDWIFGVATLAMETILDPFMGSGTTGVACANLGRRFVGIEIESKYFDIACQRIENAYRQKKLFPDEQKATDLPRVQEQIFCEREAG